MKQKKLFKALLGILFLTLGITTTTDVKDVKAAEAEEVLVNEGFESYETGTGYQSTITYSDKWKVFFGTVSTSSKISGNNSLAIRKYANKPDSGYLEGLFDYSNVTKVTYKAKAATSNGENLLLDTFYSTDSGSNWIKVDSAKALTSSPKDYSFTVSETGQYEKVRIKFALSESSTAPSKSNAQLTIDDIAIYGITTSTETTKGVDFTTSVELGFSTEYTISDEVTTATWTKVTDASTLSANDKIIIVNETKAKVAGDITEGYMSDVDNTFVSGTIPTPSANNAILTLDGTSTAWTLKNESNNLLGATAVKKLAWDNGTTTWTISIDSDGNATIQNTNDSYGRFLYNDSDPRFTTYTSSTTTSMLLPQIYKLSDKATYNFSSFSNYHLRFSTSVSESDVSRILNEGETPSDLTYGLLVTPKSYMETSDYATFEEAYQSNPDIDFEYEFMAKNVTTTLDENGGFGVILNNIPNATVEISIVLYAKDSAGNMYFAEQKTVSIKSVVTAYYNRLDTLNLTEAQAEAVKALYKSLTTNA